MCIIIDTNTFSSVFDGSSANHEEFKPVLDWIVVGSGKAVYGGSKYLEELRKAQKYLKIFRLLSDCKKTIKVDNSKVDSVEADLKSRVEHRDFDDPHLIAITIVSKCKLICSSDSRSYAFLKQPALYPKNFEKPKIYHSSANKDLLNDTNIPEKYKPSNRLNKTSSEQLLTRLISIGR